MNVPVLYGSQTGTARETAEEVWRRLRRSGASGPVCAMDEYPAASLVDERAVVFVCSTTGVGEEPDNMKRFWRLLLRKSLPPDALARLAVAVLGLGDSTYVKFNYPAKKLHKRLVQLGATPIVDVGLCDYQHDLGHDAVAEPWIERLFAGLKNIFPSLNIESMQNVSAFVPRWNAIKASSTDTVVDSGYLYSPNDENDDSFVMKLKKNERITSEDHFQDVRLITFETIEGKVLNYKPGDVFYVRPKNSKQAIDRFFQIFKNHKLGLSPDDVITIIPMYDDVPVPNILSKPTTLRRIVEEYWDLSAIPKKYTFSVMGHFSKFELEKNKCLEFCTPDGQEELFNYCNRPRRNILEVLEDFHRSAAELTLQSLFELFTCIKPRPFSIASSCRAADGVHVDLLVAVVKYYTKLKSERLGLCSNWLKDLSVGDRAIAYVKDGSFRFPKDKDTAVIMIGPGTGLAPFLNYIMEKDCIGEASKDSLMLFFGCRNEHSDFHCRDYLEKMKTDGKLSLICAFSRDQADKIYVQHKIEEHQSLVWEWLSRKNAHIYIAGSSKNMPDGVKSSIIENVLMKQGGLTKEEAEETLKGYETSGRLQLETW